MPHTALAHQPLNVLQRTFGYEAFRFEQAAIIEHLLQGQDALVLMPTGGGKSLCYQVPALCLEGVTVVVSPLIALMQDQVQALQQLGIPAAALNSTLDAEATAWVEGELRANRLKLLYVSPERLATAHCQRLLQESRIALFAIDEAHCISQWGHDFRPEYTQLQHLKHRFPNAPLLALTATADASTRADILKNLGIEGQRVFVSSFDRPNIHYAVVAKEQERKQLLAFLSQQGEGEAGIIYALSRKRVDELAAFLCKEGLPALPYHAGLSPKVRERNQARFLQEEGLIMVATVAFGMGINKPNVRFVAHVDLPKSMEGYYQETGRAGRDGLPANVWLAYGMRDMVQLRQFIEASDAPLEQKLLEHQKLNTLLAYAEATQCRRQLLLSYFGEPDTPPCGHCDNCLSPPQTQEATLPMKKLLSCIYRIHQQGCAFGAGQVLDVLRGKVTPKVKQFQHETLSTFGIGSEEPEALWRALLRLAVLKEWVQVDGLRGTLTLASTASAVLRGGESVWLRQSLVEEAAQSPRQRKERAAERKSKATPLHADAATELLHSEAFLALRQHRLALAQAAGVPPYQIFGDKTLLDMLAKSPKTLEELHQVSGVGQHKLEHYGASFLAILTGEASPPEMEMPPPQKRRERNAQFEEQEAALLEALFNHISESPQWQPIEAVAEVFDLPPRGAIFEALPSSSLAQLVHRFLKKRGLQSKKVDLGEEVYCIWVGGPQHAPEDLPPLLDAHYGIGQHS